jgi:hypothetical protein
MKKSMKSVSVLVVFMLMAGLAFAQQQPSTFSVVWGTSTGTPAPSVVWGTSFHVNLGTPRAPEEATMERAATAVTPSSILIGYFYDWGTSWDGTGLESAYGLTFNTVGVTVAPIPFANAELYVLGSSGFSGEVSTGPTCGTVAGAIAPPCEMFWSGQPNCAVTVMGVAPVLGGALTPACPVMILQLTTTTAAEGKNLWVELANSSMFCAQRITYTFLQAGNSTLGLDPKNDTVTEFAPWVRTPIYLHAGAVGSCGVQPQS